MRLLLDTHVILWWLADNAALTKDTKRCIADVSNQVFVSAASIWEIVIKQSLKKLMAPENFPEVLAGESFQDLHVTAEHAFAVAQLPQLHKDPFDRILIAQCIVEGLTLVSADANVKRYRIPVVDA